MAKYHCKATLEDVASTFNLKVAFKRARQGKSFYQSIKEFEKDVDGNIERLRNDLLSHTYRTSEYRKEIVNDSGKERLISKLPFYPDRIVHWAIMLQLDRAFMNRFTIDTNAAISGRGTHSALKLVRDALINDPENTKYCLKIDVRKYFPHINHSVLKSMVSKLVNDYDLKMLVYEIIDSEPDGVPIGNYLSQYLANLYLSYFDYWVHTELKIKHYSRYMDDMVFFASDHETLVKAFREIQWYLMRNLYLEIKDNWQIFSTKDRYIDFIGYRIKGNIVILRKSGWLKLQKSCRKIYRKAIKRGYVTEREQSSLMARLGWAVHCSTKVRIGIYNKCYKKLFKEFPYLVPKSKKTKKALGIL